MDSIEIKLTTPERDLILEHTFAGNDLTDRIKLAVLGYGDHSREIVP